MSCQRLVNAHVFNKEIHSGMRFPAPYDGKWGQVSVVLRSIELAKYFHTLHSADIEKSLSKIYKLIFHRMIDIF